MLITVWIITYLTLKIGIKYKISVVQIIRDSILIRDSIFKFIKYFNTQWILRKMNFILGVVKRNPLFLHEIEWKNNRFLFTTPNMVFYILKWIQYVLHEFYIILIKKWFLSLKKTRFLLDIFLRNK